MDSTREDDADENCILVEKNGTSDNTNSDTAHAVKCLHNAFDTFGPQRPNEIIDAMKGLELPLGLEAYVNSCAIRSEECVLEQMQENPEFMQCASWSELLDSKGFRETCNNELPLALQTIAYTEIFPDPEMAKGVDFRLLYLNLASMMMGQPIRTMNAATQSVLKKVYHDTISQISKADKKEDLAMLQERVKKMRNPIPTQSNADITSDLNMFFADPNINPLQIPMDKIWSSRLGL